MEKFTPEPFAGLSIRQPEDGYRYAVDPFILSAQICFTGAKSILDIGCGCGIIPLILARYCPGIKIMGVEIQEELAQIARHNVTDNSLKDNICITTGDITTLLPNQLSSVPDIIVSNPPYKEKGTGRLNPNTQKAIARHELALDMEQLFTSVVRLLSPGGKFYIIYPVDRLPDLVNTAYRFKMHLHFLRFVHPRPNEDAIRLVACLAKTADHTCRILKPFFIYDLKNNHSQDYLSMFSPKIS